MGPIQALFLWEQVQPTPWKDERMAAYQDLVQQQQTDKDLSRYHQQAAFISLAPRNKYSREYLCLLAPHISLPVPRYFLGEMEGLIFP